MLREKELKRQELMKQAQSQEQARLAQVELLRKSVAIEMERFEIEPGNSDQHADESLISDWNRILQDTAASRAVKRPLTLEVQQYSVSGYSSEKLLSDPRTKLMNALHAQGLLHHEYAKELLSKLSTVRRMYTISTIQF